MNDRGGRGPVRVATARNPTEAHVLRDLLRAAGIEARVVGQHLHGLSGEVPFLEALPQVWIAVPEDEPLAREIVSDYLARTGGGPQGAVWTCPGCGEHLEPQFDACWKCGSRE